MKTKKIVSLLMSAAMVFTMFTVFGISAGATGTEWVSGNGTESSPYLITNATELEYLAAQVNKGNNYSNTYFKMTSNIDLSSYDNWIPIGYTDNSPYFSGIFDGAGYTVSGITTTGKDGENYRLSGLFGCVLSGTVKNLTVDNANITATGNGEYGFAGGLIGVAYLATVENCKVINSTITVSRIPNQSCCAGGLAGYSASSTFTKCGVYNSAINTSCYGGGLIGELDDSYESANSSTDKCYVLDTTIKASSDNVQISCQIGGFIGSITDTTDCTANNCFVRSVKIIKNNDTVAAVRGGLFTGIDSKWTATNCYADGELNVDFSNGAFGRAKYTTLQNCYYNSDALTDTSTGLTGMTSSQMKSEGLASLLGSEFLFDRGLVLLTDIDYSYIPDIRSTPVTATTTIPSPTYTVTIPATVDFGDQTQVLEKYRSETNDQFGDAVVVSEEFTVSATGVKNLFNDLDDGKDDHINVTVAFDGKLYGATNIANTVPYALSQNSTTLVTGAKIATFYNDVDLTSKGVANTATATITMNRADIKNADSYTGIMTFHIAVADRT